MTIKTKRKLAPRMSQAWVIGYVEGRMAQEGVCLKNPYPNGKEADQWCDGVTEGRVIKGVAGSTRSSTPLIDAEIVKRRRALGEKV